MTVVDTLFGGIVVVALLFFVFRAFRMPNYWGGVLSGLLPLLAYIAYSSEHWQGADIMGIHVAAFSAVAAALTLMHAVRGNRNEPVHLMPKIIIGFFVTLIVIQAFLLHTATSGIPPWLAARVLPNAKTVPVYSGFSGVVAHGEEAAEADRDHLSQMAAQRKLGWSVDLHGLELMRQNFPAPLQVSVRDKAGDGINGAQVWLSFLRPGATAPASGNKIQLRGLAHGDYAAQVELEAPGLWVARLDVRYRGDHYSAEQPVDVPGFAIGGGTPSQD
ncbi:MAG: FixH family protein [Betaproteobacteria bacterium]|nr:FixH family protein [Betaproteobacteria bacterium]